MVDRVGYERDAFISTLSRLRAASSTMRSKAAPHVSSVHRELMASITASQMGHSAPLRNYCLLPDVRGAQVSPIGRGRVPARHEIGELDVSLDAALPFGAPQAALERALAELATRCGEQGASSEPVPCGDIAITDSPTEEIRRQITLELQSAPSSAWATQLRMLRHQIEHEIVERFPDCGIERVDVVGPGAPNQIRGPRSVKWRGPRDTYG